MHKARLRQIASLQLKIILMGKFWDFDALKQKVKDHFLAENEFAFSLSGKFVEIILKT